MLHSHYPLQALLYSVVLHRYLRWRLPSYAPEQHLGGVLYLFLRGMCGPETPVVDGHVAGVFDWCAAGRPRHRPQRPAGGTRDDRAVRDRRPARPPLRRGADRPARSLQRGRGHRGRRRPHRPPDPDARRRARRRRRPGARPDRALAAPRVGLSRPRRPAHRDPAGRPVLARGRLGRPGAFQPAGRGRGAAGRGRASPTSTATGARSARSATTWSPASRSARRSSTTRGSRPWRPCSSPRGTTSSAPPPSRPPGSGPPS